MHTPHKRTISVYSGVEEEVILSGRSDLSRFRLAGLTKPVCEIGPARIIVRPLFGLVESRGSADCNGVV